MTRLRAFACAALTATFALPISASAHARAEREACPDCEAGRRARSDVMADRFALHLAASVAPFAVIALVCAVVERGGRRRAVARRGEGV